MCVYIYIYILSIIMHYIYMHIHMSNVLKLYRESGDATSIMESHNMEKNMEHDVERRNDFLNNSTALSVYNQFNAWMGFRILGLRILDSRV